MNTPAYTVTFCKKLTDYQIRLATLHSQILEEQEAEPLSEPEIEAVPLEILQVDDHDYKKGIRILVRPLIDHPNLFLNSGDNNYKRLELRADGASPNSPKHMVLAITQDLIDAKCTIRLPGSTEGEMARSPLWCELYYHDPARDSIAFLNRSDVPVSLSRMSHASSSLSLNESYIIKPRLHRSLRPGTFRLEMEDVEVLDIRILGKRPTGKGTVTEAASKAVSNVTAASKGKSSSSVKYLEETGEAEEDFSPSLKRVGHVEFDQIAKANEARKRQPVQPPRIRRTTPSAAPGLEPAYGARSSYQTPDEDAEEEDIEARQQALEARQQRLQHRMNERRRPATAVTQRSYLTLDENEDAEEEDMEL
ncbi:hypothetical protein M431DRAFT_201187 [Trichoderma harzianum CBS 226.95]|uniref:Uncharacterized protein n=1 Tax=Trichoderma harzianum CBS 226.95 TaxID=983964 RepID=A0A2T4AVB0_TRIHA|nr:hypothetical protein M431DRAFT_201187 [Trichoderma harzianum CBS 226.95]PTB60969.1 hypothetical protein M431DRAFT_201187 [Trichoderma harzianum CBS 226.95]